MNERATKQYPNETDQKNSRHCDIFGYITYLAMPRYRLGSNGSASTPGLNPRLCEATPVKASL